MEIQGIPISEESVRGSTNDIGCKIGKLMNVEVVQEDLSVSHRLPIIRDIRGIGQHQL